MSDQTNSFGGGNYNVTTSFETVPAAGSADLIRDTTTAGFASDVIKESRNQPVLVDFWAPWCGPCKQLTPALERAVKNAAGKVKLVKMNIDEHPSIAGQLGIQSIPAVIAFKNGQPVDGFVGAVPESQIAELIRRLGGDNAKAEIAEAIAAAKEAAATGDADAAAQIYEAVLDRQADNVDAIAGLALLRFEAGDVAGAEEVLASASPKGAATPEIAAIRAKMKLAAEAESLGDAAELERRVVQDSTDFQARFDLAMLENARGNRTAAADNLLAIVKADRTWKDDGARSQLLQLFEAWGPMDEATSAARRKLSSLLFS